jgi:hypothetical protein
MDRERLVVLYNFNITQFALIFYGRKDVDYYVEEKFEKFKKDRLGAILDLDWTNFNRVCKFLEEPK